MNFEFDAEEESFRTELRAFLDEAVPDWWRHLFAAEDRTIPQSRAFAGQLADRGWLTMSWPREYGGVASSTWMQVVLREEMWRRGEPRGPQYMNVNYIGPMIMRFGTDEQKERFLVPMSQGQVIWCQGFSEPDAGSDLTALSTRATRDGQGYRVTGQKIWTSYADSPADWCLLLVRTDPSAPTRQALSMLLVDMTSPGVTVRSIDSLLGRGEICEVFFDDVVVPEHNRLGAENTGMDMLFNLLALERLGVPWYADAQRFLDQLIDYVRTTTTSDGASLADDPHVRGRLAELHCRLEATRLISYRAVSLQEKGEPSAVESAGAWIHGGQVQQFAGLVGHEVVGPLGVLHAADPDAPIAGWAEFQHLLSIPTTVGGGTIDIQRNIVAQQGLGLPRS